MKSFVAIAVLAVLVAAICAMPEANSNRKQLRPSPSSFAASSVAMAQAQKRSWTPSKLRRSSEEGEQIAEDQPIADEQDQTAVAAEELAADPTAASEEIAEIVVAEPASEVDVLSAAENEEEEVATSTEAHPAHPAHSFFSMNFGPMKGGAMAVANSFSTGGGKAFSHAAAHGHKKN